MSVKKISAVYNYRKRSLQCIYCTMKQNIRREKHVRPLFMVSVSAGFPSPAEDYVEVGLT